MKVYLDGKQITEEGILRHQVLGDLIAGLMESGLIANGRAVCAVKVDEQEVTLSGKELENFSFADEMNVYISTETARNLLLSAIKDGRDSCLALEMDCRTASEKFRSSDINDAAEFFAHLSSRIQMVLDYLVDIHRYILNAGLDLTDNQFGRIKVRFNSVLRESLAFQENSDWAMLADLLEYEFTDIFSELTDFLDFAACSVKKPT